MDARTPLADGQRSVRSLNGQGRPAGQIPLPANPTVTARIKSKYSRPSMPFANDLRCTSAARASTGCITSVYEVGATTASTNDVAGFGKRSKS